MVALMAATHEGLSTYRETTCAAAAVAQQKDEVVVVGCNIKLYNLLFCPILFSVCMRRIGADNKVAQCTAAQLALLPPQLNQFKCFSGQIFATFPGDVQLLFCRQLVPLVH